MRYINVWEVTTWFDFWETKKTSQMTWRPSQVTWKPSHWLEWLGNQVKWLGSQVIDLEYLETKLSDLEAKSLTWKTLEITWQLPWSFLVSINTKQTRKKIRFLFSCPLERKLGYQVFQARKIFSLFPLFKKPFGPCEEIKEIVSKFDFLLEG